MKVNLLQSSSLSILIQAIRTCYQSQDKSDSSYDKSNFELGFRDKELINRIIESKHDSTLEHIVFTFNIQGISRLCLQELARHRIASYSVKSTRYTLKELKNEKYFDLTSFKIDDSFNRASKYINYTGEFEVDYYSLKALENLRELVAGGNYSNDISKYALPESYKVDLIMTINLRSLRNFLHLRCAKEAHFEIRDLAEKMKGVIPNDYQFLLS